ncbi:MAG: Ig-like domain-containing protein, partial [Myxococcota bacterium]|nr:Ig-like domain-containing protein [Myxococcota bacterium]
RPIELGRVAGDFASVALEGALAVAGEADGGRVRLLDLSDPAAPRELAAFQRAAPARALALAGDSIFAVGGALDVIAQPIPNLVALDLDPVATRVVLSGAVAGEDAALDLVALDGDPVQSVSGPGPAFTLAPLAPFEEALLTVRPADDPSLLGDELGGPLVVRLRGPPADAAPGILSVSPAFGAVGAAVAIEVVVEGDGVGAELSVAGVPVAAPTRLDRGDGTTTLGGTVAPLATPGAAAVTVISAGGARATRPAGYAYLEPLPAAASVAVAPMVIAVEGGELVSLAASGLGLGTRLLVDGALLPVRSLLPGIPPALEFRTPAGPTGPVPLALLAPDGSALDLLGALVREDTLAPMLTGTVPPTGSVEVPPDQLVVLEFSEPVRLPPDPTTAFRVLRVDPAGDVLLPGDYAEVGTTLSFDPFGPAGELPLDADYRIEIDAGIVDRVGNGLLGVPKLRTFRTFDTEPPTLAPTDLPGAPLPTDGTPIDVLAGTVFSLVANAEDNLQLSSVRLVRSDQPGSQLATTPPYRFDVAIPDASGEITLELTATDRVDNETLALLRLRVTQTVDTPPSVSLREPAEGAPLPEGAFVAVEAAVGDDRGIVRVELLAGPAPDALRVEQALAGEPEGTLVAFSTRLPFAETPTPWILGVRAFDAGAQSSLDLVSVTVTPDALPPVVEIASPPAGSVLVEGAALRVEVAARDNVDLDSVRIAVELDGALLDETTRLAPPYRLDLVLPAVDADTPLRVTARAEDGSGNARDATPVDALLADDARAPLVALLDPPAGARIAEGARFPIVVEARDDRRLARVTFSVDGQPVATLRAPPFRVEALAPSVAADRDDVPVVVTAFDSAGNSASASVAVALVDDALAPEAPVLTVDPEAPVLLGGSTWQVGASAPNDASGTLELVATRQGGDASTLVPLPADAAYEIPTDATAVRARAEVRDAAGNRAALEATAGVEAYLADRAPVASAALPHAARRLTGLGDRLWVASGSGPLLATDASLADVVALGDASARAVDVAAAGGLLWVAEGPDGLALRAPDGALRARVPAQESVTAVVSDGPVGYAVDGRELLVVDARDATGPRVLDALPLTGSGAVLALAGPWLVAADDEVLVVFDRGDARQPVVLGEPFAGSDAPPSAASVSDDRVAVARGDDGVDLLRIEPAGPRREAHLNAPARAVAWSGARLLALGAAGLTVYDATDLARPVAIGRFPAPDGRALRLDGERLTVGGASLRRFELAAGPLAPAVALTAPVSAAAGAEIELRAEVADDTGASVSFFVDGAAEPVATTTSAPHRSVVALDADLSEGALVRIVARVRDQRGAEAEDFADVRIAADGEPPVVLAIDGPDALSVDQIARYRVRAVDPSSVVSVALRVGGVPLAPVAGPPFELDVTAPGAAGLLELAAVATDAAGNDSAPFARSVLVTDDASPLAPTVSIASPANGAPELEGRSLAVVAVADDPDGSVVAVELELAGRPVGTVAGPPFAFALDLPIVDGFTPLELRAVAVDDGGNRSLPDAITVSVNDDTVAPGLELLVTPDLDRVLAGTTLELRLAASDNVAVAGTRIEVADESGPLRSAERALSLEVPAAAELLRVRAEARDRAGNLATVERELPVLDARATGAPTVLTLPGTVLGVSADDTRLFASAGPDGVHELDVSDPLAPSRVRTLGAAVDARAALALGERVWVADGVAGLALLDRASGAELGRAATRGAARHVLVLGALAYTAEGAEGVAVFDVAESAPREIGRFASTDARHLAPAGAGLLLLADGAGGVRLLDVAGPGAPRELARAELGAAAVRVAWRDGQALVTTDTGLRRLALPGLAELERAELAGASGLAHSGPLAVAAVDGGVAWLDAPPAGPWTALGRTRLAGTPRDVAAGSAFAAVALGDAGVGVLPLAERELTDREPRAQTNPVGIARRLAVDGPRVYVASGPSGVQLVDLEAGADPVRITHLDTPGAAADVAVVGDFVYVADGFSGVTRRPAASFPGAVAGDAFGGSTLGGLGSVTGLFRDGSTLYAFGSSLALLDVSDPANPVVLASGIETPGDPSGLFAAEGLAYLADGTGGLRIFDVSDSSAPRAIGAFDPDDGSAAEHVTVFDGTAFVAAGPAGLRIVDVRDPAAPALLATVTAGGVAPLHVSRVGQLAVLSDGARIALVDVADPAAPQRLETLAMPDLVESTLGSAARILVAAGPAGVQAVELGADLGAPAAWVRAPADGASVMRGGRIPLRVATLDDLGAQRVDLTIDGAPVARLDGPGPHAVALPVPADVPLGASFALGAEVIDGGGQRGAARPVSLRVDLPDREPPSVALSAPAEVAEGARVELTAEASDELGVPRVQFLADGALLASDATPPYAIAWDVPLGTSGAVTVTARALDDSGNAAEDRAVVSVLPDAGPPSIAFSDLPDALIEGTRVRLAVDASDDRALRRVELLVDGAVVASDTSAPFELVLAVAAGSAGAALDVQARAVDGVGNVTTTAVAPRPVVIDTSPVVTRFEVAPGLVVVEDTPVSVTLEATDDVGVASLALALDGEPVDAAAGGSLAASLSAPEVDGATDLSLVATAEDGAGQVTTDSRTLRVLDDAPPALLSIETLPAGPVVEGSLLQVRVSVADDVGATRVELLAEGVALETAPFGELAVFDVVVPALAELGDGRLDLSATVFDRREQSDAAAVAVTVVGDLPPTLDAVRPADGATLVAGTTLQLAVDVSDDLGAPGIASVRASASGAPLVAPVVDAPLAPTAIGAAGATYELALALRPDLPAGPPEVSVSIEVVDAAGNRVTSSATYPVVANQAPVVRILSPTAPVAVESGTTLVVEVEADDDAGQDAVGVVEIAFAATGDLLASGSLVVSPARDRATRSFAVDVPANAPVGGQFTLVASARDALGRRGESAPLAVEIADGVPPAVTLLEPPAGTTLEPGAEVTLRITASDTSGVREVSFFTSGAAGLSDSRTLDDPREADASFRVTVPADADGTQPLIVVARARDPGDNTGQVSRAYPIADRVGPVVSVATEGGAVEFQPGAEVRLVVSAADAALAQVGYRATDEQGGVVASDSRVVSGQDVSELFSFVLPAGLGVGERIDVVGSATDLGANVGVSAGLEIRVVDRDGPAVSVLAPPAGSGVERGTSVAVRVEASDPSGVIQLVLTATGAVSDTLRLAIDPPQTTAPRSFDLAIPSDAPEGGTIELQVSALDAFENAGALAAPHLLVVSDTTPPTVVSVQPADGSTGVALETAVTLAFSEPVDGATIGPASVLLVADPEGAARGVAVDAELAGDGRSLLLTPLADLDADTLHEVSLTAAVRDLADQPLEPFRSRFTTETDDRVGPRLLELSPADDAADVSVLPL